MITKSKVRSIHSSLAIEENSLSLLAVESLYEEKIVLGKRHEIQEVKNAIKVYNKINTYDYKNELDLINVLKLLMKYMNEDNGYRNHGEGVKRDNKIIYMAPESILVPSLMSSLFELLNNNDLNLIVLSSIFHYYFVSIHPFSDGNGRVARFWMSLMLLKYNKNFEYIPIEEEIYLNREEYYKSIEECHNNGNANIFIRFILITINTALDKLIMTTNFIPNKIQNKIIEFITNNNKITQNEIAEYLGVNVRTIKRNFKVLIDNSIIERIGSDKTGYWQIIK
jgi:Fic family protein